jgi:uncharacterized membrane protein YdfJ with MMPL/SSD domain
VIKYVFEWINLAQSLASWNCGGVLTMLTPFIFLLGAVGIWVILGKDLLLYLGVKLRVNGQQHTSAIRRRFWENVSKVSVRVTLYVLQGLLFALGQATTSTTTLKTCNDIDLIANSFG